MLPPETRLYRAKKDGKERPLAVQMHRTSVLDFGFHVKAWLDGDRIESGQIIAPEGVNIEREEDLSIVGCVYGRVFWVAGSIPGKHRIEYLATTAGGRTKRWELFLIVKE